MRGMYPLTPFYFTARESLVIFFVTTCQVVFMSCGQQAIQFQNPTRYFRYEKFYYGFYKEKKKKKKNLETKFQV